MNCQSFMSLPNGIEWCLHHKRPAYICQEEEFPVKVCEICGVEWKITHQCAHSAQYYATRRLAIAAEALVEELRRVLPPLVK